MRRCSVAERTGKDEEDDLRPVTFRTAYVFDVEQTDPLPDHEGNTPKSPEIAVPVLTGEHGGQLYSVLLSVASEEGITVDSNDGHHETPSLMGFYLPRERRIWVRPTAPLQVVKTLANELAHHCGCHDESNPNNAAMAEGAAYVVLQAVGLDSGERSAPYIVGWDAKKARGVRSGVGRDSNDGEDQYRASEAGGRFTGRSVAGRVAARRTQPVTDSALAQKVNRIGGRGSTGVRRRVTFLARDYTSYSK